MSTARSWRISAALFFCVFFGDMALAQTPVIVCPTCTAHSQLYAHAHASAINNPQIPLNGTFLSTTQAPYTYRQCYQKYYTYFYPQGYTIIINPVAISYCPDPGPPIGPPILPLPAVEQADLVGNDYYTKAGDYNADGLNDLYVTGHPTRRFVQDFIIFNHGSSYTINANPTAAQRTQASSMPFTSAKVARADANGDALYDFIISDTWRAIPGHSTDIIVLTNKGGGSVPQRAIAYTAQMKADEVQVAQVLSNPQLHLSRARTTYCRRVDYAYHTFYRSIYLGGDTVYSGEIPSTTADRQLAEWLLQQGSYVYHPDVVVSCVSGLQHYSATAQQVLQRMEDTAQGPDAALILQAIFSEPWTARLAQRDVACQPGTIANAGALSVGIAVAALILVVAQAITDTDPDTAARALTELARFVACYSTIPIGRDWGPVTSDNAHDTTPDTRRDVSVDAVYRAAQCPNPEGGTQFPPDISSPTSSSTRLRKNLGAAGCGCPAGDSSEAHHMVASVASAPSTRAILRTCGIHPDFASNGVCLPTASTPGAGRTTTHEQTWKRPYYDAVDSRIGTANANGGCQGVKNALQGIRSDLLNGVKFW